MAQLKDLIVNGPSRFIGDVYATTFTGNLAGNANTATNATNAGMIAGLSVHSGRNNEANKIVRTDQNGYLQVGYINSSSGHEKNASNPTYVWGSNSSDSYLRSYQTSSLSVNYATTSGSCSGNAATATNASSAGNADKLDGVHYQNILERYYSGYASSGTATGWFRIAETLIHDEYGPTFLLAIQRSSSYVNNESYLFSISISYNGGISITQLSGYANSRLITKIRVDWANSKTAYVDLYINTSSTNNNYYWYTVGCAKSYTTWTANPTLVGRYPQEFTTVQGCKSDLGFTGYLTGTASSSYKWRYARTITLTGSVTGSVSIDGSDDVTLATTTNHTHTFASLTSKPTTLSEYGITDALTHKYITHKEDFQRYVILLCRIGTNTTNDQHTINGTFWTNGNGSSRYNAAYINVHCSDWLNNHNEYYGFTPFGLDKKCRLVTCTYQSSQYLAITFEGTQAAYIYFDGSYSNILFTPILYYTSNTSTVGNSEIYNSITEVTYNKIPLISSEETALTSSNFNSYCPKLDGTGAKGTWGISISGNAATATNADLLDGYHATCGSNTPWGTIPVITRIGWMDVGKQFEFHYDNTTGSDFSTVLRCTGNYNNLVDLPSASGTLALTTDNVASATKLATSRTIWGQSFDGTGNVSGGMGAVSYIEMSYSTPFIDFHYGNSTADYTSRIIEGLSGQLTVTGKLRVGLNDATSTNYAFHVVGDGYFTDNVITESDFISRGDAIIDGNVGIGAQRPDYNLDVYGNMRITGPIWLDVLNSNGKYFISTENNGLLGITYDGRDQNPAFLMNSLGYVYLNCDTLESPAYPLVVNGTIQCTKLSQTSDIKYKTNIKQIEYEEALKIIENLNPVTWDWNENTVETGSSSGFVAQEAEEFIPNAISRDNENNLSLDYTQLHSYEIKVIQEQQKEIIKLKEKLKILEKLIS